MFINLTHMREAVSVSDRGNKFCTLSQANVQKLQQANYLFHNALNGLDAQYASMHFIWASLVVLAMIWNIRSSCGGHRTRKVGLESQAQATQATRPHACRLCACIHLSTARRLRTDHICLDLAPRVNPLIISTYMDEDCAP